MTSALSTRQRLLTKAANRLSSLLNDVLYQPQEEGMELPVDIEERRTHIRNEQFRLRKARKVIEMEEKNVESALQAYNEEADNLAADTPQISDILEKVKAGSTKAEDLLEKALSSRTKMAEQLEELAAAQEMNTPIQDTPRIKLAPVPIPKFSGRVWEWEAFWSAFDYSIHSRNMDDVYKMNYLLDSLRGEAQESVKKFEISGNTYQAAVEHLKSKYGNPQLLITQLVGRLKNTRARSKRMEDQRRLCEEISSIVNQLQLKGEAIDGALLQQQVLSKFTEAIQRHVLRKRRELMSGEPWSTNLLLKTADNYIQTELDIHRQMEFRQSNTESTTAQGNSNSWKKPGSGATQQREEKRSFTCFFCEKKGHPPKNCPEFKTREERIEQMKNLCLCRNCGSTGHMARECTKGACRLCNVMGHHTSLCRKLQPSDSEKTYKRIVPAKAKPQSTGPQDDDYAE
ncbi:hypothetical protein Y032_0919g3038 [Ancylostoma ceylanicum]|uniref:CCHC-type domain-containing protein n=1 Tax=Ancylostoma ceylanicum TaxID=53326 RepID=A0A016W9E2_9BILA|nr:hypothetical protein Y032_0919g3038 [Ancylostoma ceylanicum]